MVNTRSTFSDALLELQHYQDLDDDTVPHIMSTNTSAPVHFPLPTITKLRDEDQLQINGNNFSSWKKIHIILFEAQGVYDIVNGLNPKPNDKSPNYAEWIDKDAKARAQLCINLQLALLSDIPIDTANDIWKTLIARFETTDSLTRSLAHSELKDFKITDKIPIKNQIAIFRDLRGAYINAGGELTDSDWKDIIIGSLFCSPFQRHLKVRAPLDNPSGRREKKNSKWRTQTSGQRRQQR